MTPQHISSILWDCLPAEEKQAIAIEATRRMASAQFYGSPDTSCCDCPRDPVAYTPIEGAKPYNTAP